MKPKFSLLTILPLIVIGIFVTSLPTATAQNITFFFPAGVLSGEPDRFGNSHTVGPAEAIEPRPFGDDELLDGQIDEDNLWLIYPVEGNSMLVSHSPGGLEDSPEIFMDITTAISGKYEVILNFLDERDKGAIPKFDMAERPSLLRLEYEHPNERRKDS